MPPQSLALITRDPDAWIEREISRSLRLKSINTRRGYIADLKAFVILRWLSSGKLDHIPSDLIEKVAPKLNEYMNRVAVFPAIAQYYSNCGPS